MRTALRPLALAFLAAAAPAQTVPPAYAGYWPMSMVWSQIGVNSQGGLVQAGLGAVMRF